MIETLTSLEAVFVLSGILLAVIACFTFADRGNASRLGTGLFWLLLAVIFALGSRLPAWATGTLVIAMVVLDGFGLVRQGNYSEASPAERVRGANRFGWRIFLPVLMIPALTYAGP